MVLLSIVKRSLIDVLVSWKLREQVNHLLLYSMITVLEHSIHWLKGLLLVDDLKHVLFEVVTQV